MIDHVLTFADEAAARSALLSGDATWDVSCTIPGVQIITGETPSAGADEYGNPLPPMPTFAPGWSVLIARNDVDAHLMQMPECTSIKNRVTGEQVKGAAVSVSPVFS